MNRQQKELVIESFHKDFSANKGSFFVEYSGLTVAQMQQLRRELRAKGGALKVAKMRLIKKALADIEGSSELLPHCKNQLGVVFVHDASEVSGIAKTLNDFSKTNEALGLVVGCVDARVFDAAAITRIATLPSREVLLAQVCGALNAPLISFVHVLNAMPLRLLLVLKQIEKQKQA